MHEQPIGCWKTKACLKRLFIRPRHNQLSMDSGRRDASYSCPPTKSGQLSMDPISMRAVAPESSMDPISVQTERLSVQKTGPWTISSAFFAEIPSMDPVLMHAVVQGPRIGAETSVICADIGSMDEFGLSLAVAPRSAVAMNSISSSHPCARGGSSCLYPLQRIRRLFTNFTWHRLWKRSRKNESSVRAKSRKDRLLNMGKGVGLYQHPFIGYIVVL